MFEDICYKESFLTEVVARIDFVAPVAAFERNISAKALKKIGSHFPVAEPRESIAQHIELRPDGGVKQKELRGKQWNFFGKEREKQLTIEPGAVFVRYTKYSRFEDLKDEFQEAVSAIDQEASGIVAQRFGLRYINQYDFEDLKLSNVNKYFTESLLGTLPFNGYARNLTRNFHIVEFKFDDIDVRFQFGFTKRVSPSPSDSIARRNWARSVFAPLAVWRNTWAAPAACNCFTCSAEGGRLIEQAEIGRATNMASVELLVIDGAVLAAEELWG